MNGIIKEKEQIKTYKKDNFKIDLFYNKDNQIDRKNKPAILVYDNEKLIAWAYLKNGLLHRNNKPALFYKDNEIKLSLYSENGIIHRDNNKNALYFNNKDIKINCIFSGGLLHSLIKPALIIDLKIKELIESHLKHNHSIDGFNTYIKTERGYSKHKKVFHYDFNLIGSLIDDEIILKYIFTPNLLVNLFTMTVINNKNYQTNTRDLPNVIFLNKKCQLTELQWKNELGKFSRSNEKAAIIKYEKNTIHFYHLNNDLVSESALIPYYFSKSRHSKVFKIKSFKFNNDRLQEYYEERNFVPFFLSLSEMKAAISFFN